MPAGRTEVDASLYHALRAARPDIRPILASKATLVATSHLVEDLVASAEARHVLMSGFQHGRHWQAERDRYQQLSDAGDVIAVFAGREPPPGWGVDHIGVRLGAGDPLTQEWFVLALGPEVAVTLCGLDADGGEEDGEPEEEGARLFEVIWSFDPDLAETAADVVLRELARVAPDRATAAAQAVRAVGAVPRTPQAVAREADELIAGLVDRVERLRGRERTVERRTNEAKTEFLSRMSHELRTPLNAILGFTQLLQLAPERPAADRESLEHIADAGGHLLQLIDEVLDISRIETGRLPLSLGSVDAREALREVLALIGPLADARGLRVTSAQGSEPAAHVHADAQRLRQILLNLLSNAVKYNAADGELAVTVAAGPDDTVRIAVRDTGPGIAPEELPRLFVPFERLPSSAGTSEGTGLGLALSQRMAQAMGGRIEVDSRRGRGSIFTVVLPAAPDPAPAPDAPEAPASVPARRRVLHVEDNPSNLRLVERLLAEHADVELVSATRGGEGLALAREHPPDLVLLDLDLPDLPGIDVLRALRADPRTADVPVVVVSSDATTGTAERLEEAGAVAFITKPLDVRRLLATVAGLLDERPA